eukprot:2806113-Prymnesium_polylepis.1
MASQLTPYKFFALDDTPMLIEDSEGNMVRSLQIHPLISVITILEGLTPGLGLGSWVPQGVGLGCNLRTPGSYDAN